MIITDYICNSIIYNTVYARGKQGKDQHQIEEVSIFLG